MKLIKELRSEEGAASVLEATIVFPLVFLVVLFLIFLGLTYGQQAYLQMHSARLSDYISKTILYPGYQNIEKPFYSNSAGSDNVTLDDVNTAMKQDDPYRYLCGLFKSEYRSDDKEGNDIVKTSADKMVDEYLRTHGFLKSGGGDPKGPSSSKFNSGYPKSSEGFMCVISANTSCVSVYLAQTYTFARFFRMIGVGGKTMTISAASTAFITDSVEFIRNVDMVFDAAQFLAQKLGIDIEKITSTVKKITGNE